LIKYIKQMNMKESKSSSRRKFIGKLSTAAAGAVAFPHFASANKSIELKSNIKPISTNDTIQIGAIGMGIMGFNNCQTATSIEGTKLVATCDLYDGRLKRSKELFGKDLFTTRSYKEILDRDDIDAVIVATSDHWHDHITIEALKKGKTVYCEKPMVHRIEEGQAVIKAASESKGILQIGSQRASSVLYHEAARIYKEGSIGDLILIETYTDRQSANGAWQYSIPPDASEKTIDWETFLGDAPHHDFDPVRFFRWRNYQDYGTGVAGDLFVHLFTGIHVILDSIGPNRIFASVGLRYWKDGRDVPDVMLAVVDYPQTNTHPAFNMQIRVNFVDGGGGGNVTRFIGSEGVMTVGYNSVNVTRSKISATPGFGGWDSYNTFPEETQKEYKKWYMDKYGEKGGSPQKLPEIKYAAPQGYNSDVAHHTNLYNAMREGKKVLEDGTFGLRTAGPSLACNLSYFTKKIVNWDPVNMKLLNT
jgi:predicted dehydrogenase